MKNWKTTVAGLITAGTAFVAFSPELFVHWPVLLALAKFTAVGGLATLGLAAKDGDVTGGTRQQ